MSQPSRAAARLRKLLLLDPSLLELQVGVTAVIWAALLLPPWWCTECTSPNYRYLALLPEWELGFLNLFLALAIVFGRLGNSYAWRRGVMAVAAGFWSMILIGMVIPNPATTAWVYLVPFLSAVLAYAQLGVRRDVGLE